MNKLELKKVKITKADKPHNGITPVNIRVAQPGKNRNGFNIPKDVLESAVKETMGLTPIIGLFNPDIDDFKDHGEQITMDERGNIFYDEPRAIGVIPENVEYYYDDKDYLCVKGFLWTDKFPQAKKAIGKGQSMELNPEMTEFGARKNGFTTINKTGFLALTVLGDSVEPCFEDAKVESGEEALAFSLKDSETEINNQVQQLLKDLEFSFTPENDILIDITAQEKDKENREKITEAIDDLEDALEDIEDEDALEKTEDALRKLVSAETDMKSEPEIVILNDEAKEILQGIIPNEDEGDVKIVSKEEMNYKNNTMAGDAIDKQRTAVSTLRLDEMLKTVSNADVMKFLIDRIGDIREFDSMMKTLTQTMQPLTTGSGVESTEKDLAQNAPEIPDVAVGQNSNPNNEPVGQKLPTENKGEESDKPVEEKTEETTVEEKDPAAPVQETETETTDENGVEKEVETQESVPAQPVEEKTEEKVVEEKDKQPEEEKKKKAKSLNHALSEAIEENNKLREKIAELETANKELLDFKLKTEKTEKENILAQFSISKEAKEAIRNKFDELTFSEVEEKAVFAQYKESKISTPIDETLEFSDSKESELEFSLTDDETEILRALNNVREKANLEL